MSKSDTFHNHLLFSNFQGTMKPSNDLSTMRLFYIKSGPHYWDISSSQSFHLGCRGAKRVRNLLFVATHYVVDESGLFQQKNSNGATIFRLIEMSHSGPRRLLRRLFRIGSRNQRVESEFRS